MAAVPKNKRSKSKRDMKRNSYKLAIPSIVECPRCRAKKIAHRVCLSCGYYKNNMIINLDKKNKEKAEKQAKTKKERKSEIKNKANQSTTAKK